MSSPSSSSSSSSSSSADSRRSRVQENRRASSSSGYRRQENRDDRQRQVTGDAQAALGNDRRSQTARVSPAREEMVLQREAQPRERRSQAREEEARQRDEEARQLEKEVRHRYEEARQRDEEARQRDRDQRPADRWSRERENRDRSRTPHARSPSPAPLTNFSVCHKNMREFRGWMTSSLKSTEAKQLRESLNPNFINSSFELKCPHLDSSMARRFKDPNIKGPELSKAEANEKSLKAEQYKILDVARPLLFLREKMSEREEFGGSPMANAVDTALRLWGHTFHGITASRRENLLKISDPKFVSLLSEPSRFKTRQCGSLFGRTFIKGMVKEARDDQQLRIVGRGSAPSSSRGHGSGSVARGAPNGFQRNGSSRGGHYGGSFNNGGFNRGGAARNNTFNNNRGRGHHGSRNN